MYRLKNNPPRPEEICAVVVTTEHAKRAALLFDRVWCPNPVDNEDPLIPDKLTFYENDLDRKAARKLIEAHQNQLANYIFGDYDDYFQKKQGYSAVLYTTQLYRECGYNVLTYFESVYDFGEIYENGTEILYEVGINKLKCINMSGVSWEQILDFRKDQISWGHFRSFRIWVRSLSSVKTVGEAEDILCEKLEKYESAIKKHGFETIVSGMKTLVDSKFFSSIAIAGGGVGLLSGDVWGAIAAGAVSIPHLAFWITERRHKKEEILKGPDSQIAVIHNAISNFD